MAGQGAIIGVGAMDYPAEFAGASEDRLAELGVGKLVTITSTYDHRVIQGAQSGEFLGIVHKKLLGLDGFYDRDGRVPAQVDGGLKCFGHPIGASGLRMLYEMYLQLLGRAGKRQLENPRYGLTHNLGGFPHQNVCAISIVGKYEK